MESQRRWKRVRVMAKNHEGEERRGRKFQAEGRQSLQALLNNQLVCENIASYLSLSDVKAASEVNRQFLQAMRGTRRFAQKAVLAITDRNAQKATLEKTEYLWRGVRIDVTDSSDILDDLPRVLKSAQFVCLGALPGKIQNARSVKDPTAARLLTTVLNSTPALSHLQIGIHFLLVDIDLRTVLSSPAVQTLANLSRLEILEKMVYDGHNSHAWLQNNKDSDEEKNSFGRNFCFLTELPNRLKTFDLPRRFSASWMETNQSVLRLLRNNTPTMEQLSLYREVWSLQELGILTFPMLKTFSVNVWEEEEEELLAKFLEDQQRPLEELTVELGVERIMPSIQPRCMELQKLDLTIAFFSGDVEEWSFLGSMNRLKEFQLKIVFVEEVEEDGVRNWWRLLAFLPKNQLEILSLEGFSMKWSGFWRKEGGLELELAVQKQLLQGFRCLKKLSFVESRDAVDDQLMQWLLKEFTSLEDFQLSDCSTLTDAGISGKTTAEWGRDASFVDLRRLTTLKMLNCPAVTPNGVASSVKLPFLKSLEHSHRYKVRQSVVLELVGQNPRLERLGLNFRGDLANLRAKVSKVNPRVELVMTLPSD